SVGKRASRGASAPSTIASALLVVPKSMPMARVCARDGVMSMSWRVNRGESEPNDTGEFRVQSSDFRGSSDFGRSSDFGEGRVQRKVEKSKDRTFTAVARGSLRIPKKSSACFAASAVYVGFTD